MRLTLRPYHSTLQIGEDREIWRRCSSSPQSLTVDPDSTVPSRFVAPAWNRSASTRDVFPVPRCPTTATLRIFPGSSGKSLAPLRDGLSAASYLAQCSREARVVAPESRALRRRIALVWS